MGLLERIKQEQERERRGSWQVVESTREVTKATRAPWVELALSKKLPVKDYTNG